MPAVTAFTPEQEKLWDLVRGDKPPVPSGDQTVEQARAMAIGGFQAVCQLEGLPIPSRDAIDARLARARA